MFQDSSRKIGARLLYVQQKDVLVCIINVYIPGNVLSQLHTGLLTDYDLDFLLELY